MDGDGIVESRALRLVLAVVLAASVTVAYVQVDGLSMWFLVPVASAACALLVERRVSWAVATCLAAVYAGLFFIDVDRRWFFWLSQ